jgi:ATP-binding cassette subfamily G (WHITE) protein 2 (PDR)
MYRGLRASDVTTDADYQATVYNFPFKYASQYARKLLSSKWNKEASQFDILKSMDAIIRPGEVVFVLGRPGSVCTTLLKSIASNTHGFHISEDSQISYGRFTPRKLIKHFRGEDVYSAESDIHFPHLTVWQTLNIAAKLRTPRNRVPGVTREQYSQTLTDVYIATYGLSHTKNTKVGSDLVHGVSGGERKRVSIAEVSLAVPRFNVGKMLQEVLMMLLLWNSSEL